MRSKLFVASVLCGSVLLSSAARATIIPENDAYKSMETGPLKAIDLGRSIVGIIQGVLTLCGDGDAKAELIATQEETNTNADGTAGEDANAATTSASGKAGATALTNGVYSYVRQEILSQTDLTKYAPLKNAFSAPSDKVTVNGEAIASNARGTCGEGENGLGFTGQSLDVCRGIVNTFFADIGEDNITEEYKAQILAQRRAYAKQVGEWHTTIGYEIQQRAAADLVAAARAPVGSDNEIGAIAIDGQTLDEMLKIVVADVGVQIEMMEADAAAFLLHQPIGIMPKEKPVISETGK